MSAAIGPTLPADAAQTNRFTTATFALAIGAPDVAMSTIFAAAFCRRIVAQANGTIYVQRQGDSGFAPYAVTTGVPLEGIFVAVGGTGSGSSAITVNLEV
jgi:hypothetical protein